MDELRDLYQEIILDHNRSPRNFREIEGATHRIEGFNPLCGDRYTIFLTIADGVVQDVAFQGAGCAISKASASLMSAAVKGKPVDEAEQLFQRFHDLVASGKEVSQEDIEGLGKLAAFAGVRDYPMRVKCATLAWHTLHAALEGSTDTVTTE